MKKWLAVFGVSMTLITMQAGAPNDSVPRLSALSK